MSNESEEASSRRIKEKLAEHFDATQFKRATESLNACLELFSMMEKQAQKHKFTWQQLYEIRTGLTQVGRCAYELVDRFEQRLMRQSQEQEEK